MNDEHIGDFGNDEDLQDNNGDSHKILKGAKNWVIVFFVAIFIIILVIVGLSNLGGRGLESKSTEAVKQTHSKTVDNLNGVMP